MENRGDQILNSFEYVGNSIYKFIYEQPFIFIVILILIILSFISNIFKQHLKKKYIEPYEWSGNTENKDFYVKYYQKIQYVDFFGAFIGILLIFVYLLTKNTVIGAVWAVGVGGILITFQTFSVSLFTYFLLIKNYKVGDTIRLKVNGDTIQGQILYLKLLHVGMSGKNDFGENTGESFVIPNYQMWNNPIVKVDLSLDNYAKDSLTIIYDPKNFNISFEEFSNNLKKFLDDLFPVKSASNVAYFKSYIGVKYKIDYKYDGDGKANIWIGFVEKRLKAKHMKLKIISFVEDQKKTE